MKHGLYTLALIILSVTATAETLVDKAFDQLRGQSRQVTDRFEFAVVGDTRSTLPVTLPQDFFDMIAEWNRIRPDFVVDVGDLVLGGAAEGIAPQWDEFERVVGQIEVPFFPVAGNHDVFDPATEKIYTDRIGPMRFAFSYGNSRFIMLNSEEQGQVYGISEGQLNWLKEDLEQSRDQHIFVFLHQPFFAYDDAEKHWAQVHKLLKAYPVKLVVGCHWHVYRDYGERDGIRYIVTGGGGAERHDPEEEGGFAHYIYTQVRGDDVHISVIKPGNVLADDVVTNARIQTLKKVRGAFDTRALEVPYGEDITQPLVVTIDNPLDVVLEATLQWKNPPGWVITPEQSTVKLGPGNHGDLQLEIQAVSPEIVRYPVPELITTVTPSGQAPIHVQRPIKLIPLFNAPKIAQSINIDGRLDEWEHSASIPLPYGWDFDISDTDDLQVSCRFMWDENNFYIAVEVDDDEFHQPYAGDIVWSADNVQLFINDWEWGLSLTTKGPEVFLYKGVDVEGETINYNVRLGIHQEGRRTIYEAAFPKDLLPPDVLKPGGALRCVIVENDLDPSVPDRPRHWAELTPGAGSGAAGFPRAKIVME